MQPETNPNDAEPSLQPIANILKKSKGVETGTEAKKIQNTQATEKLKQAAPHEAVEEEKGNSIKKHSKDAVAKDAISDNELQAELETLKKRTKGTQKAYNEIAQKLKNTPKKINKYMEDGILNEAEASVLLNDAAHDALAAEIEEDNPLQKLFRIGNEGIHKIRQSIEEGLLDLDPLLDKKIRAFDLFLEDASRQEIEEAMTELAKLEKEPIKLAKKMIALGQNYYEEVYGDIEEAGSLRNFKKKYQQEIESLQKTIDKQEKQILKYQQQQEEGYIPSKSYTLPTGGSKDAPEQKETSLKGIFERAKSGKLYGS